MEHDRQAVNDAVKRGAGLAAIADLVGREGVNGLFEADKDGYNCAHLAILSRQLDVLCYLLACQPALASATVEARYEGPREPEAARSYAAQNRFSSEDRLVYDAGRPPLVLLVATWEDGHDAGGSGGGSAACKAAKGAEGGEDRAAAAKERHRVSLQMLRALLAFGAAQTAAPRATGDTALHIAVSPLRGSRPRSRPPPPR